MLRTYVVLFACTDKRVCSLQRSFCLGTPKVMKRQVDLLLIHADKDNLAASAEENLNLWMYMCFNFICKQFSFLYNIFFR